MTSVGIYMCVSHLIPNITNWCITTWKVNEEKWHSVTGSTCYFRNPSFNTRNMLTMDGACTLWKPHTAQLVNHPENQFCINAYGTSKGKSKTFFFFNHIKSEIQSSSSNKLGKWMAKLGFLPPLGKPIFSSFIFKLLILMGGNEGLCLYPGWF